MATCVTCLLLSPKTAPAQEAGPAAIASATHFIDTFSSGRLSGWTHRDLGHVDGPSNWRVARGAVRETSNVYGGSTDRASIAKPGTILTFGNDAWGDYDYSVDLSSADDDAIGVIFRYQDASNFYRFSMDQQRHYRRLVRVLNGQSTLLAESDEGYSSSQIYRVGVSVTGSRLQVELDGVPIFDVDDDSIPTGQVGLYAWGSSSTTADNVDVQAHTHGFTIAVVPDTQYEVQDHPAQLRAQMRWLAAARAQRNIALVLQEGDVVNRIDSDAQWATASRLYRYLDGKVPFVVAVGNHDEMQSGTQVRPLRLRPRPFNAFIKGFADYQTDGTYQGDERDSYRLLTAGGVDLLVLNLEFGAPDAVLDWAEGILAAHPSRHAVVLTHDYLDVDGTIRGTNRDAPFLPHSYNPTLNDGVVMWRRLVTTHPQVEFTLNGHVNTKISAAMPWSAARRVDTDQAGRRVYEMLADYQSFHSGLGYLRLLHFVPTANTVTVSTYSPYTGKHLTDGRDQFAFTDVDLGGW